jgi:hypothetical protein
MGTGHIHLSMLALAGPKADVWYAKKKFEAQKMFDRIVTFDVPDDYGEFPDTTGYTSQDWEKITLQQEDGALYPFMTKCMDVVLEYTNHQADHLDRMGYQNIEKNVHWPKFGGTMFACTGHVTGYAPSIQIVRH